MGWRIMRRLMMACLGDSGIDLMQYAALTTGETEANLFLWNFLDSLTIKGEQLKYISVQNDFISMYTRNSDTGFYLRYDGKVSTTTNFNDSVDLVNTVFPTYSLSYGKQMYDYLKALTFEGNSVREFSWSDAMYQWSINNTRYYLGDGGTIWLFDF